MNLRGHHDTISVTESKFLIIDTDAGGDDAQALILAFHLAKKYKKTILGITAINGNTTVGNIVKNILITMAICGDKYPVFKGSTKSMMKDYKKDFFFSEDGLGGKQAEYLETLGDKIDYSLVQQTPAYKFIAQSALHYQGQLAIIALGPLTNLALAYSYENTIVDCIAETCLMGGSDTLCGFNESYTSQFNIGYDPQASYIVLNSFPRIRMISFDTTVLSIEEHLIKELFYSEQTPKGKFISNIFQRIKKKEMPLALCDPLAVIVFFRPDLVQEGMNIRMIVQLMGKRTRGATLIDYFSEKKDRYNAYLVKQFKIQEVIQEMKNSYE